MTNLEILEKAINLAIDGGWKPGNSPKQCTWMFKDVPYTYFYTDHDFIFNHDFAKALWGEEQHEERVGNWDEVSTMQSVYRANWKWHLQQMVTADDPIQYLGSHLE